MKNESNEHEKTSSTYAKEDEENISSAFEKEENMNTCQEEPLKSRDVYISI